MNSPELAVRLPAAKPHISRKLRDAQKTWSATEIRDRLRSLRLFRTRLVENAKLMASSACNGRLVADVLAGEILPLADACRFLERNAAEILRTQRMSTTQRPFWLRGVDIEVHREALGVVLIVAASNYPLLLPGVQMLQALAAGNAVLLKPAPGQSASAYRLAELCGQCGMEELVQVLDENASTVREAIHEGVAKIFFTGSAEAGRAVLAEAAAHITPSVMELSGCDALIVSSGADIAMAARALCFGLEWNGGLTCIRPARVLVQRRLLSAFLHAIRLHRPQRGVQLSRQQQAKMRELSRQALVNGAGVIRGSVENPPLLLHVKLSQLSRWHSDAMLPLALLSEFDQPREAISLVNEGHFRLGLTIFAGAEEGRRLAAQMQVGVVVMNDMIVPTADPRLPFGGRGCSGFGTTRGVEGLLEMTAVKAVAERRARWWPHFESPRKSDEQLFLSSLRAAHAGTLMQRWRGLNDALSIIVRRGRGGE